MAVTEPMPTPESLRRLKKLKRKLQRQIGETPQAHATRIVLSVKQVANDWPDDKEGEIGATIAIIAWRGRLAFSPGPYGDVAAFRVLIRWMLGYSAHRAYPLASAASRLHGPASEAGARLKRAGGVDRLGWMRPKST